MIYLNKAANKVAPVLAILVGVYWVLGGIGYGLWINNGPGGGLFPLIGGIVTIVSATIYMIKLVKSEVEFNISARMLTPILTTIAAIIISYLMGLILSLGLMIVVWLKCYEQYSLRKSLTIGVATSIILYLIFVLWLKTPLPMGIFKKLLY